MHVKHYLGVYISWTNDSQLYVQLHESQQTHNADRYMWAIHDVLQLLPLVSDDIKSLSLYESHNWFNQFVCELMRKRQDILSCKTKGNKKFYKISMNDSYSYDGMNTENFSRVRIFDKNKSYQLIASDTYRNGVRLSDDCYLIQS